MITTSDGKIISDSGLIIGYLKDKYGNKLDASLTKEQHAQALSLQRLIEEHLYWVLMYTRWVDENGWAIISDLFFSRMPAIPKLFVPKMVRKHMFTELKNHGMGLHDRETVYQFGRDDVQAIADTLGDKLFVFGDTPTSIDACVFATIANIIYSPIENPLKTFTLQFDRLKKHTDTMKATYFPS